MIKIPFRHKVVKPKNERTLFGLLRNDLEFVDTEVLSGKIHEQSQFSILYLMLLIASVVVCTLGLLTNSTAIVIGGMLIAPLMWPLARLGYGIALKSPPHLYRGALLVAASILIGTVSAYIITSISPIKVINDEILARTSPTIMDLFIALAAGFVAAIAITQKKIADSLAGVAIAVSLMPPLCTVGIALSLRNYSYSLGALLLFAVNAACITLVTTVALAYIEYTRTRKIQIAKRAATINVLMILLLSVPLVQLLRSYTSRINSYNTITTGMSQFIEAKDPSASFENIEVARSEDNSLQVYADLLLPSDSTFTYEDNEVLVDQLENNVDKRVLLNLRIQNIIEPISKNQKDSERKINDLSAKFADELSALNGDFQISSISISEATVGWAITSEIVTSPDAAPTSNQVSQISRSLSESFAEPVAVNLTFVPRLTLRSGDQSITEEAKDIVENATLAIAADSEISAFSIAQSEGSVAVEYTVTSTQPAVFTTEYLESIRTLLDPLFLNSIELKVRVLQATDIRL